MFLCHGLTIIHLSFYFLTTILCSSQMVVLYLSLYPRHPSSALIYKSCKISQLILGKIMSGPMVLLRGHLLTPYPDSQVRGLFVQNENQHALIPRDSGNSTSPTVKPLTVRGSHKTSFLTYKLLTLITLYTNQRHLPIY